MRHRPVKDLVTPAGRLHAAVTGLVATPARPRLFLGDLPQVSLPVRLVLVQGPGECRGLFPGHLCLSLGPHGLGLQASSRALSAFVRARSAFPGGSRLVWLLMPLSIVVLAALLISPMMIVSWGSGP